MIGRIRVGSRIVLIVIVMAFCAMAVQIVSLADLRGSLLVDRQEKTKSIVESAQSIVADLEKRAARGDITVEGAKEQALRAIENMRYGNGDYLFASDIQGIFLAHPTQKGKNYLEAKDDNGFLFMRRFIEVAQRGGGFVPYYWRRVPNEPAIPK